MGKSNAYVSVEARYSAADAMIALMQYGLLTPSQAVSPVVCCGHQENQGEQEKCIAVNCDGQDHGTDNASHVAEHGRFHTGKNEQDNVTIGNGADIQTWMLEVLCEMEDASLKELTRGHC